MRRIWIIKAGTTFPETKRRYGDFDEWTRDARGLDGEDVEVVDVDANPTFPEPSVCGGVVITGAHAMVTDSLPWSVRLERWVGQLLETDVPFLGICYGHQLLAQAMGGQVGYHCGGREIGTVQVDLASQCNTDPLLGDMPQTINAHVVHAQTVLQLPRGAVRLAYNDFEPHHAFRLGAAAWGVQFHPEYDARIMRSYIRLLAGELSEAHRDVQALLDSVQETPAARGVLARFAQIVREDR